MLGNPDLNQMEDYEDAVYDRAVLDAEDQNYEFMQDLDEAMDKLDKIGEKIMADNYTVDTSVWEAKLAEIDSDLDGKYIFPKKGKTNLRFMLGPNLLPQQFYHPVVTQYKEQLPRTRYMAPCIVLKPDNTWSEDIKFVVFGKMVLKDIITILAGGDYDLLHPEHGHGVTINRTGEGKRGTKYQVIPSKDPVAIDPEQYEWPQSLEEAVLDLENPKPAEEEEIPF